MIRTTVIRLTPEETSERIAKMRTRINLDVEETLPNTLPTPADVHHIAFHQRDHWRKLHAMRFTPEEFEIWVQGIPGCSSCQRDFRRIVKDNPPRYNDFPRWTWEVHNTVNRKLGKPEIQWEDACELWGWETTKETQ